VSESWPLTEINRFLIFSAQGHFRPIFSGLGILGPPFWASEYKFSILKTGKPGNAAQKSMPHFPSLTDETHLTIEG
jgi:hypothetical protein